MTAPSEVVVVTLRVAGQLCGLPVGSVRDILGDQPITPVPLAPPEVAGNLNLRGRIVTAIDLRRRLHLPDEPGLPDRPGSPDKPGRTRMAVVTEQGSDLYALLVDQVHEVLTLGSDRIEPNPATLPPAWSRFSQGVCRLEESLMIMLDIDRLLALVPEAA